MKKQEEDYHDAMSQVVSLFHLYMSLDTQLHNPIKRIANKIYVSLSKTAVSSLLGFIKGCCIHKQDRPGHIIISVPVPVIQTTPFKFTHKQTHMETYSSQSNSLTFTTYASSVNQQHQAERVENIQALQANSTLSSFIPSIRPRKLVLPCSSIRCHQTVSVQCLIN